MFHEILLGECVAFFSRRDIFDVSCHIFQHFLLLVVGSPYRYGIL
jgi:hypothetical protein